LLGLTAAAQALTRLQDTGTSLYVITSGAFGPDDSGIAVRMNEAAAAGFSQGISVESPALHCTRLDCAGPEDVAALVQEVLSTSTDRSVAWRGQQRNVARLGHVSRTAELRTRMNLRYTTGIDGLEYVPAAASASLGANEVEIEVHATAMNFRDVLQALGVVQLGLPLGTDCAGVVLRTGSAVTRVKSGDPVIAIAPSCYDSHVITREALVVRKPVALSFPVAVAQCVAYLTADFALSDVAHLRAGERVLIHAAASGVGLAAVYLAQRVGAEVIATAGSERKREFLRSLGVAEVYDSRSREFAARIQGGVDVVLNSLAGQAIEDGLSLLRPGGRFVELGKTDLRNPDITEQAWPGVRYLPADLSGDMVEAAPWIAGRIETLLADVAAGRLPALPAVRFTRREVREAFRSMMRAEHIGRVVIEAGAGLTFRGTHLVTGGLRGIGPRLAEWLAERGAEELVLLGRRAPEEDTLKTLRALEARGIRTHVLEGDAADAEVIRRAVSVARDLRGVWHSAGVLHNAPLEAQTWETIVPVLRPKVDGAWHLHVATEGLPLDQFVLFSSWASIEGSHGQANHCAANAWMDALAHWRRQKGLPALSLNWGAWGEIGAAAGESTRQLLARAGMEPMPPAQALGAMGLALAGNEPQVAIAAIHWEQYRRARAGLGADPDRGKSPREAKPHGGNAADRPQASATTFSPEGLDAMAALPPAQRRAAIEAAVAEVVRATLGLHPGEAIDPQQPLMHLGVDSLLAIELRNGLSTRFGRPFPATLLFDQPSLHALVTLIEGSLAPLPAPSIVHPIRVEPVVPAKIQRQSTLSLLESIEQMSDEEVELQDTE
jgi:NADPH:quinone reductase-like Zn-dependent oxidoreductase/acyl carrier protein